MLALACWNSFLVKPKVLFITKTSPVLLPIVLTFRRPPVHLDYFIAQSPNTVRASSA